MGKRNAEDVMRLGNRVRSDVGSTAAEQSIALLCNDGRLGPPLKSFSNLIRGKIVADLAVCCIAPLVQAELSMVKSCMRFAVSPIPRESARDSS